MRPLMRRITVATLSIATFVGFSACSSNAKTGATSSSPKSVSAPPSSSSTGVTGTVSTQAGQSSTTVASSPVTVASQPVSSSGNPLKDPCGVVSLETIKKMIPDAAVGVPTIKPKISSCRWASAADNTVAVLASITPFPAGIDPSFPKQAMKSEPGEDVAVGEISRYEPASDGDLLVAIKGSAQVMVIGRKTASNKEAIVEIAKAIVAAL